MFVDKVDIVLGDVSDPFSYLIRRLVFKKYRDQEANHHGDSPIFVLHAKDVRQLLLALIKHDLHGRVLHQGGGNIGGG
jgi:hypothetical protein